MKGPISALKVVCFGRKPVRDHFSCVWTRKILPWLVRFQWSCPMSPTPYYKTTCKPSVHPQHPGSPNGGLQVWIYTRPGDAPHPPCHMAQDPPPRPYAEMDNGVFGAVLQKSTLFFWTKGSFEKAKGVGDVPWAVERLEGSWDDVQREGHALWTDQVYRQECRVH